MKRLLFILISFSFLLTSYSQEDVKKDTAELISVGYDYIQVWDMMNIDKKEIDKNQYKLNLFTRLKYDQDLDQFLYYTLEELNLGKTFKSFLIYEYYESESAVWLVNYTNNYDLIDALEVYYDNAEGAWSTTSVIDSKKHTIVLTQYDAYQDTETTIEEIKVLSDGKFEEIKNN